MNRQRDLARVMRRIVTLYRDEREFGTLGRLNADGTRTIASELRPGFVMVEMDGGTLSEARWLGNVALRQGMRVVILVKHDGDRILEGEDYTLMEDDPLAPSDPYGVRPHPISSHSDVTITAAAAGDILVHNGTDWVDSTSIPLAMAATIHAATLDTTPLDADEVPGLDSSASFALLRWTWTSIKAFLKTYFDTLYNLYVHPNHTGDVTSVGDGATTIAANAVTYAKMQDIATDSLIGRDTAATGDPETISLGASLSMTGAQVLQRAALTGDVTAAANSNATTIANDAVTTAKILDSAVTYAKIQNVSATDKLLGRSTAGAGVVEEIALTAFARSLIDDIDAAAARTTLGLGTMAVEPEANYLLLAGRAGGQTVTGLSTGPGLKVLRNLADTSTDSPVVDIVQDHASDDQTALRVQQDGTGTILSLLAGAAEVFKVTAGGDVGMGATVPAARLDFLQPTLGSAVQRFRSTSAGSDPTEWTYQNRVTTTNATVTTLHTFAIAASTIVAIVYNVVARRTGGSSGAADDSYFRMASLVYKNVAGTATLVGSTSIALTNPAAWGGTQLAVSGADALLQVEGLANVSISWHMTARVYEIST